MPGQSSVQTVLASQMSSRPEGWSSATAQSAGMAREGPSGASAPPMDTEDSLLVTTGLPGCQYRFASYSGPAVSDMNPAFGLQLHHPRFLEFIGAPQSACLLYRAPTFWVDRLGEEPAMAAAVNLQRDAGIMLSNLQILSQFVTSLHRMSSEMLSIGMGRVVFPTEEIADLSPTPRVTRAASYMAAMGLWRWVLVVFRRLLGVSDIVIQYCIFCQIDPLLPRTWRRWVCGALRRVRVIPGQCQPRPATLA